MTHANIANLHAVFDLLESGECTAVSAGSAKNERKTGQIELNPPWCM